MRTWMIGILVAVVAAALGVGAAYGGSELFRTYARERAEAIRTECEFEEEYHKGPLPFLGRMPDRMRGRLWDRLEQFRENRLEDTSPEQ
jgi:hypothetical protein